MCVFTLPYIMVSYLMFLKFVLILLFMCLMFVYLLLAFGVLDSDEVFYDIRVLLFNKLYVVSTMRSFGVCKIFLCCFFVLIVPIFLIISSSLSLFVAVFYVVHDFVYICCGCSVSLELSFRLVPSFKHVVMKFFVDIPLSHGYIYAYRFVRFCFGRSVRVVVSISTFLWLIMTRSLCLVLGVGVNTIKKSVLCATIFISIFSVDRFKNFTTFR